MRCGAVRTAAPAPDCQITKRCARGDTSPALLDGSEARRDCPDAPCCTGAGPCDGDIGLLGAIWATATQRSSTKSAVRVVRRARLSDNASWTSPSLSAATFGSGRSLPTSLRRVPFSATVPNGLQRISVTLAQLWQRPKRETSRPGIHSPLHPALFFCRRANSGTERSGSGLFDPPA
jgi:hypothetical protein